MSSCCVCLPAFKVSTHFLIVHLSLFYSNHAVLSGLALLQQRSISRVLSKPLHLQACSLRHRNLCSFHAWLETVILSAVAPFKLQSLDGCMPVQRRGSSPRPACPTPAHTLAYTHTRAPFIFKPDVFLLGTV